MVIKINSSSTKVLSIKMIAVNTNNDDGHPHPILKSDDDH